MNTPRLAWENLSSIHQRIKVEERGVVRDQEDDIREPTHEHILILHREAEH